MRVARKTYRLFFALVAFGTVVGAKAQTQLQCPDSWSHDLLRIAREPYGDRQFNTLVERYRYVIENATRPMDESALRSACYSLARHYFRTKCSDYGYKCPPRHNELLQWPASMNEWISELKANYPILRQCPEKSLYSDERLPVVRVLPIPTQESLAQGITGWVQLELDIDAQGTVENVSVIDSSSHLLEQAAINAARGFIYKPSRNEDYEPVPVAGVEATIRIDYGTLARFVGCPQDTVGH